MVESTPRSGSVRVGSFNRMASREPNDRGEYRSKVSARLRRAIMRPHHAYLFTNRRANRMKVLVHDGIGIWLAARRLNQGQFVWPQPGTDTRRPITQEQLAGLVLGLPWQRIGQNGVIRVV